jgi:predicted nucleic acid-binding protein
MRIVLDTNILVRAVSGRSMNSKVFDYLFNQEYTLCISTEILLEYEEISE